MDKIPVEPFPACKVATMLGIAVNEIAKVLVDPAVPLPKQTKIPLLNTDTNNQTRFTIIIIINNNIS